MPPQKSTSRKWGISARPTTEDLPEWTKDFQGPGWAATPNPEAVASKRQRKARLLLGSILAALPVSLLSCLIAVSSSSDSAPAVEVRPASEWSLARSEAQLEAQRWLRAGGLDSAGLAWRESRQSLLTCSSNVKCEDHIFKALLGERSVLLVVTADTTSGDIVGVHLIEDPTSGDTMSEDPDMKSVLWSDTRNEADNDNVSLDHIEARIREWTAAWATGKVNELRRLAGENPDSAQDPTTGGAASGSRDPRFAGFAMAASWWLLHPDEVEVVSLVEGPSPSMQLATVTFSLARSCVDEADKGVSGVPPDSPICGEDECDTGESRSSSAGARLCDGSLDMTADLWIEASREPVQVLGSAHVGGLDPNWGPAAMNAAQQNRSGGG